MKKTLLVTMFFPPESGGIQSYLYNLTSNLQKDKILVFCHGKKEKEILNFDQKQSFKIFRANFKINWLKYFHLTTFYLLSKLRKICKRHQVEKILCGHLPLAGPLAFFIKNSYGLPYSIFTHGMEIFFIKNLGALKQRLFRRVILEAEKIITTTDFMAKYLKEEFGVPYDQLVKISPGVDSKIFRPIKRSPRESQTLPPPFVKIPNLDPKIYVGKKCILTCGRLVARKNHISVIRALPQIIREISNVLYLIAGSGLEEKTLKNETARLHLEKYVAFLGKVVQKSLPTLYNLADVFVMPARNIPEKGDIEGFGVVFLEAAACGKPCVAGNTGGQGEAVQDGKTGILVNPENVNEIASVILKLLQSPDLAKKLGEAGRRRTVKQFNWKLQAEKLYKILE